MTTPALVRLLKERRRAIGRWSPVCALGLSGVLLTAHGGQSLLAGGAGGGWGSIVFGLWSLLGAWWLAGQCRRRRRAERPPPASRQEKSV